MISRTRPAPTRSNASPPVSRPPSSTPPNHLCPSGEHTPYDPRFIKKLLNTDQVKEKRDALGVECVVMFRGQYPDSEPVRNYVEFFRDKLGLTPGR